MPSAWSSWTDLGYFNVESNDLDGTVSSGWSSWTDIGIFDVSHNQFTGTLPASWSGWTNIKSFDVSYNNNFQGTVPEEWYPAWPNRLLQYMFFEYNCLQTNVYPTMMSTWLGINAYLNPQDPCITLTYLA